MAHRLNTNKQFMVGNGILAFAVIFVVVIFVYMSMRLQREKQEERHFIESYTISLVKGFAGDSISLFVNDSLISNKTISEEPYTVEVGRFAEQSALLIVDNNTELVSTFDLSEKGGTLSFLDATRMYQTHEILFFLLIWKPQAVPLLSFYLV